MDFASQTLDKPSNWLVLRLSVRRFKHCVLVAGISEGVIKIMNFLSSFCLELDLKKKYVTISEEEVVRHSRKDCSTKVRLFSDGTMPARSQTVTQARTKGDAAEGRNVLLEPKVHDGHEGKLGHWVLEAWSNFLSSEEFPVLLMNVSDL